LRSDIEGISRRGGRPILPRLATGGPIRRSPACSRDDRGRLAGVELVQRVDDEAVAAKDLDPVAVAGAELYPARGVAGRYAWRCGWSSSRQAGPSGSGEHMVTRTVVVWNTSLPPGRSSLAASNIQRAGSHHKLAPQSEIARSKLPEGSGTSAASAWMSGKEMPSTRPARRAAPRCSGRPGSAVFGCTAARCPTATSRNAPARCHGTVCAASSMGSAPSSAGPAGEPVGRQPQGRVVQVGERGFLLMPGVHLWPHVAAIVEEPWLPTPTSSAPPLVSVSALLITGLSF
jgi:hypothetical protein